VESLLMDLGLPVELLSTMRAGSTERAKPVAEEDRYVDPVSVERVRRGARVNDDRRGAAAFKVPTERAFGKDGNGRGKPLARTRPPRGAVPGQSGRGSITGYDSKKGFGFIKQDGGGKDVFFHRKAVVGVDDRRLRPGTPVSFALDKGESKKLRASRVEVSSRN
jgi:CspA family cold shock protein